MIKDRIVDEVRANRQKLLLKANGNLDKLMDYLKDKEKHNKNRIVFSKNTQKKTA